jgi:peptidoglycan hydrolase-like protein with peptidoglycan-binding domain
MKNKIIKLTEQDLKKIVEKVLNEQGSMFGTAGTDMGGYRKDDVRNQPKPSSKVVTGKVDINPKKLKLGDGGSKNPKQIEDVKKLQAELIRLGLLELKQGPTGFFGSLTQKALDRYNKGETVKVDTSKVDKGGSSKNLQSSEAAKKVAKCETGTDEVLKENAKLLFDGDKLYWITNGKVVKSWDGVSGLTWKNTPPSDWGKLLDKYTKTREAWSQDKNAGPLPEGQYSVGPLETRSGDLEEIGALEAFWYKITGQVSDNDADRQFCKNTVLSRISWGNYRAPITPTGGQKMYGRGSFYLHGGSLRGSHGCIDLTDQMEDFAKFMGIWTSTTKNKKIPLTVKYKNPALNQVIQKLVNLV